MFSDNWKEYPELCEEMKVIRKLHRYALAEIYPPFTRTSVCRHSDYIKIEIPKTYNKNYFTAEEFSRSIGKHENVRDIHMVSFHVSEVDNIMFLLHCIGEKIGYGVSLENMKYPEIVEFLNKNHPMYALADAITDVLEKYNRTPSVYYAGPVESARKTVNDFRKKQNEKINELYANMIGEGKITVRWKSEYKLYSEIKSMYPDAVFQFRSDWLGHQSLDIFVPSISTAIEYQGKQHYEPVEHFGGESAFLSLEERDKRKKEKCIKNNVRLLYWKYDVPISVANIEKLLSSD